MMTKDKWEILQRIVQKPLTSVDLPTNKDIRDIQELTNLGYVRDFGQQHGRRIPVNLRIWGITSAGRAVLEQQTLVENQRRSQTQFGLSLIQKPVLTIKPVTLPRHTKLTQEKKPPQSRPQDKTQDKPRRLNLLEEEADGSDDEGKDLKNLPEFPIS